MGRRWSSWRTRPFDDAKNAVNRVIAADFETNIDEILALLASLDRQIPLIYRPPRDRREGKVSLLMDGRRAVVPIEMIAAYKAPKYPALLFIP